MIRRVIPNRPDRRCRERRGLDTTQQSAGLREQLIHEVRAIERAAADPEPVGVSPPARVPGGCPRGDGASGRRLLRVKVSKLIAFELQSGAD